MANCVLSCCMTVHVAHTACMQQLDQQGLGMSAVVMEGCVWKHVCCMHMIISHLHYVRRSGGLFQVSSISGGSSSESGEEEEREERRQLQKGGAPPQAMFNGPGVCK